ncbi:MAG: ABC transporter substrate-binding protein [Syntrophales bacterium]|nr:ABC transporter substrate-binding protein [Syntrophales bacterium]
MYNEDLRILRSLQILTFLPVVLFVGIAVAARPSVAATALRHVDRLGRHVEIPVPVKRVVFLQMYELIPVLEIWDRVVGLSRYAIKNDLLMAARPNVSKLYPIVGGGTDINLEVLVGVKPELIITWAATPEQVRFLERKGFRIIAEYPETINELCEFMRLLGRIFQCEQRVSRVIVEMESVLRDIRARLAYLRESQIPRVLWLGSRPTTVACRHSISHELISIGGGKNPAGDLPYRNIEVSLEQIIKWNPDVIFIWGSARYGVHQILNNPRWRIVNAVKKGRVYKAPEWSTWSPRVALLALWMAMKIHPDLFKEVSFTLTADRFYRKFFGIPSSHGGVF